MLLRLYPWDYRAAFSFEMLSTFEQRAEQRGRCWRFVAVELAALAIGAGREWIAKLTTDPIVRGRALPDVRLMRPPGIPREIWFRATERGSTGRCSSDMSP
jgi:hypothetical protein